MISRPGATHGFTGFGFGFGVVSTDPEEHCRAGAGLWDRATPIPPLPPLRPSRVPPHLAPPTCRSWNLRCRGCMGCACRG